MTSSSTGTPETPPDEIVVGDDDEVGDIRTLQLLRRGVATSPELRDGLAVTVLIGLAVAVSRLSVPVVIQRILDSEPRPDGSLDTAFVAVNIGFAFVIVVASGVMAWWAQLRLVLRAESAIANLRTRAFNHIHRLSVADHNESRRGVLVARVTSDAEALARFAQWGLYSWSIQPAVLVGIVVVLLIYSWQLGLVVIVSYAGLVPALGWIQRRQIVAYDRLRSRVADMLATFSEVVMGAAPIRAYGAERRSRANLDHAIQRRYSARIRANAFMSGIFVVGDFFGAVAFIAVLVVGLWQRTAWDLSAGELLACLFLTTQVQAPVADLSETLDQTQTAAAGWRKILNLLDRPIDVVEPSDGVDLEPGPITIEADGVGFSYRDGGVVLDDVSIQIPAGTKVAIVGETGSGKTTFAKLLCRLADPVDGAILLNGIDLRRLDTDSRLRAVRMVPQDGFLFDTTVLENVGYGRGSAPGGSVESDLETRVLDAFRALDLMWWVDRLEDGVRTRVGERGENLSVGERQLVALARAQLADPGLLVLDEATSAVDPETDQALTGALRRLAEGRTLVSIAHRLATAEAADLVLVFDQGRLVERGSHTELVALDGVYGDLHRAWIGNTRSVGGATDVEGGSAAAGQ